MGGYNWEDDLENVNVNEAYELFLKRYDAAIAATTPLINSVRQDKLPWFNRYVAKLRRHKFSTWTRYKMSKTPESLADYKAASKGLKEALRSARRDYEQKLASNSKQAPKLIYGYINKQLTCKDKIRAIRDSDGKLCTDTSKIVELINEHFYKVWAQQEDGVTRFEKPPCTVIVDQQHIDVSLFSESSVVHIIKQLNTSKSAGVDGIRNIILKKCVASLSKPLSIIFTKSFN
jgi:hypothetical protein